MVSKNRERSANRQGLVSDFDGDDQLGHDDLEKMIRCLTRDELTDEEVEFIIDRVCFSKRPFSSSVEILDTDVNDAIIDRLVT